MYTVLMPIIRTITRTIVCLVVTLILTPTVRAQIVWEPWAIVPLSKCICTNTSVDVDPDCIPGPVVICSRRDGKQPWYPAFGTPAVLRGNTVTCTNCPKCCKNCTCVNVPTIQCGQSTVSFSEAIILLNVSSRLSGNSAAAVGIKLANCVGYAARTCTSTCDASASPCIIQKTTALLSIIRGQSCRIEHEWVADGAWSSSTGTPADCPISGFIWSLNCGTDSSMIRADLVTCPIPNTSCDRTYPYCGPLCP